MQSADVVCAGVEIQGVLRVDYDHDVQTWQWDGVFGRNFRFGMKDFDVVRLEFEVVAFEHEITALVEQKTKVFGTREVFGQEGFRWLQRTFYRADDLEHYFRNQKFRVFVQFHGKLVLGFRKILRSYASWRWALTDAEGIYR